MNNLEKNIKEIVNTGLGALAEIENAHKSNKMKVEEYIKSTQTKVDDTKTQVAKYLEELKLKGTTDDSELSVTVRNKTKEIFETVDSYIKNLDEFTSVNYAKLKLELAKHDITLPEVSEIQNKFNSVVADGKDKIEKIKTSLTKEKVAQSV